MSGFLGGDIAEECLRLQSQPAIAFCNFCAGLDDRTGSFSFDQGVTTLRTVKGNVDDDVWWHAAVVPRLSIGRNEFELRLQRVPQVKEAVCIHHNADLRQIELLYQFGIGSL